MKQYHLTHYHRYIEMVRAKRLLVLIDLLSQRTGYTAKQLSEVLEVSERTVFRDIKILREEGAQVDIMEEGGFHIRAGWTIPPVKFSSDELDAIALGLRWVTTHADPALKINAQRACAKLTAVLSVDHREKMQNSALIIEPQSGIYLNISIDELRKTIQREHKIKIDYQDLSKNQSQRVVWPFAIAYYDGFSLLIAWCEKRGDFRSFRTDRIFKIDFLHQHYPNTRLGLYDLWLQKQLSDPYTDKK